MSTRRVLATSFNQDLHLMGDIIRYLNECNSLLKGIGKGPIVKVVYIGIANEDSIIEKYFFKSMIKIYARHWDVQVLTTLDLLNDEKQKIILDVDLVFVGGGNTINLVKIFQKTGFDQILREAYEKGVIMGGVSAGLLCWFQEGLTDSYNTLSKMSCLEFLPFSCTPHGNQENRHAMFSKYIKEKNMIEGFSVSDGTTVLFENEIYIKSDCSRSPTIFVTPE